MAMQDEISAASTHNDQDHESIIKRIENASQQMPQLSPSALIHRVPDKFLKTSDYKKYYAPKVVSIGPYHYGNPQLELVEKHKPGFMLKLLSRYEVDRVDLCQKFEEAISVQQLREFYEEDISPLPDKEFTTMMLLDACFILYYIEFLYYAKKHGGGLESYHIVLIQDDLFLVENQIPFKILNLVMDLIHFNGGMIDSFIKENILAQGKQKSGWFRFGTYSTEYDTENDHLLHRMYHKLTRTSNVKTKGRFHYYKRSSIKELMNVGIHFKPSSSRYLEDVEFHRRCWWFSADLKLPPIGVERLLNLLAYEMCSAATHDAWVISYVCLLDSLIDQPDDVKALRNAGILDDPLGKESDPDVAKMFSEIGKNLVPNNLAYSKVKRQIQNHCDIWRRGHLTELRHDYLKSPWSLLSFLVGTVLVLFLSAVQTYFTVWSPKSECDHLCKFLKINHHL